MKIMFFKGKAKEISVLLECVSDREMECVRTAFDYFKPKITISYGVSCIQMWGYGVHILSFITEIFEMEAKLK